MRPSVVMRESMRGADCTRPSSTIASWRPMFSPVTLPNLRPPSLFSVKLTAGWLFSSSDGARVAQVAAGDRRHLPHQVVDRAAVARPPVAPGTMSMPGGTWPFCSSASRVAAGPCSTIFSSSRPVDRMISLRALDVGDAGQLHENLIAVVALLRDARLGDAELVDAALDRLPRLHDGFVAQVHLDVRLHRERVGAVAARSCDRSWPAPRRPPAGTPRPAPAARLRRGSASGRATRGSSADALGLQQLLAQPLHLLLGLEPQRIVGLHAQHEVHAALQVEPELELLVHQPAPASGCRSARRRSDRRRPPKTRRGRRES